MHRALFALVVAERDSDTSQDARDEADSGDGAARGCSQGCRKALPVVSLASYTERSSNPSVFVAVCARSFYLGKAFITAVISFACCCRTGSMAAEEGMLGGGLGAKLKCPTPISRLRVEKIEGGLMVAGVVIAANCQIALPAFGTLFMLVGAVLTAASYRGPGEDEDKNSYAARIAFTGNSRILGPICIVVGALMLALGVLLCMLTRRARRRERRVGFHCPLHGDFYPLSPVQGIKMLGELNPIFHSIKEVLYISVFWIEIKEKSMIIYCNFSLSLINQSEFIQRKLILN
ncbi:hypothetical protein ALC53_04391 [Atta colombica]|uniref:Uncharacterized protein n=1 Tax=Atta colombica TaxID=520822 RepID=A0A195BKE1_9HYME|nr:hypothetical protein ALC53_04391 [Atta colombica]